MVDQPFDEKAVFLEALNLPEAERAAFLAKACPDDASRQRIEILIRHQGLAGDEFLADTVDASTLISQPMSIDEFEILHRIGEGGMGVVYLARDTILGRRVALKILAGHLIGSEQAIGRFRDEARSAAALQHPAIVPVFKAGQSGQQHYLVSEYVAGQTLADLIAEQSSSKKDSTRELRDWYRRSAEIVAQIADALDCAHRAKIVHRDVKPSNVLIDPNVGPRLTDFGIAKHLIDETRQTQTGLVGSCHYMSPEQASIATSGIDHRSDIFSLGVVLYEMLSGKRPFDGETMPAVLRSVIESNPRKLRLVDKRIPVDLETICHKAMEKRPQDRYQTAAHIAADLRCFLSGDPILARPPSLMNRIGRFLRKRRVPVVTTAIVSLATILPAIALTTHLQYRASLTTVSVTSEISNCELILRMLSEDSQTPGSPRREGTLPTALKLPRGLYRMVALASDGSFSETTVAIVEAGEAMSVHLGPPAKLDGNDVVLIKGGEFAFTALEKAVTLPDFYIDLAEVSNAQYREFLKGRDIPPPPHWEKFGYREDLGIHPIVAISWQSANAYCRSKGMRLPSRTEWEYAMSRPDSRLLPWTAEPPAEALYFDRLYEDYVANSRPVISDPDLRSANGLFHGLTNVKEFTESISIGTTTKIFVKGGSWPPTPPDAVLSSIASHPYDAGYTEKMQRDRGSMQIGFRCACSANP